MTGSIDQAVQDWMVGHRSAWLTHLAWAATYLGTTVFVSATVVVLGALVSWRRRQWAPLVAFVAADVAVEITARSLKQIVGRDRPPAAEAIERLANSSLPSAHVARAALWCTLVVLVLPRRWRRPAAVIALVLVVVVAWTRVYLGSHWLTDTLVAWPLGMAAAWAAITVAGRRPRVQAAGSDLL